MSILKFIPIAFVFMLIVTACQGSGQPLLADAGSDFTVSIGEAPTFDACSSSGNMINFQWRIVEAPDPMVDDAGKLIREFDENCSFTLAAEMGVDEVGEWVVELEVKDDDGNVSTDTVRVTVVQ